MSDAGFKRGGVGVDSLMCAGLTSPVTPANMYTSDSEMVLENDALWPMES